MANPFFFFLKKNKTSQSNKILETPAKKIKGWSAKFLWPLTSLNLQSTPIYTMNIFKVPKTICKKSISSVSKFWWNSKGT